MIFKIFSFITFLCFNSPPNSPSGKFRSIGEDSFSNPLIAINGLEKLSSPILLNLPDGELGGELKHKKVIKENILKIMPDLIITHAENDYHADHKSLSLITKEASLVIKDNDL